MASIKEIILRSFHGELLRDNDAKGSAIVLIWAVSSLAVWKSGGGIYEQAALGSLALLEAIH